MPDTNTPYTLWNTSEPKRTQATGFRRRHLLDQWDDAADEFRAIETAALDYLRALDNRRLSTYGADAVKRIDNHASDFAGRALDLLSDMHGEAQKAADEEGIDPDSLTYDDGLLRGEFDTWTQRAEARRTPRFPDVSCSSCGQSFGPGDEGFSHCQNHAHLVGRD